MGDITNNTPTKENTMTIIATNNTGDIILVREPNGKRTIRTSSGSILVEGQFSYVLKKWETFKNT
jgi:hypothetical protein